MNLLRMKRRSNRLAFALLLGLLTAIAGCSGSGSPVNPADQYQQKVYVIGEIRDPDTGATEDIAAARGPADAVKNVFVNRIPYDGASTDAPIFIASDQLLFLGDAAKKGIRDTYRNSYPIVLVRGNEAQINALLEIVGLGTGYKLPESFSYTELFAVDRDAGAKFTWALFPPGASRIASIPDPFVDTSLAQLDRAKLFSDWMKRNESRMSGLTGFQKSAEKALAADGARASGESNLRDLAQVFQQVKVFTDPISGNSYQLIFNIYSCHSFSSADGKNYDWFYIEQNGSLSASAGYRGIRDATIEDIYSVPGAFAWGGQQTAKYYIGSYEMSNSMMSQGGNKSDLSVVMETHSPDTNNNETSTRSGISYNISGNLGFKAGASSAQGGSASADINGGVSGGVTITHEDTIKTQDCTVQNKARASGYLDEARWLYTFKKVTQYGWDVIFCRLNNPVNLSVDTFNPYNKWIWKFSPDVRDGKKSYKNSFKTKLDVENMTTISGTSFLWTPTFGPYHGINLSSFEDSVMLDYPPLIVAPSQNVTFSAAGQVKYMDAHVATDWSASSDQAWCQAVPATGTGNNMQVSITVEPNSTGKERKSTVTFTTKDGRGRDTMIVTQSQY